MTEGARVVMGSRRVIGDWGLGIGDWGLGTSLTIP